jgi:spore maturation protein B
MQFIQYLGSRITPIILVLAILYGMCEKKNVFELFLEGVCQGEKVVIKLFPTLLALLVAVGMLQNSGIINFASELISGIIPFLNVYKELIPFVLLRSISGSTSTAIGTNLMQVYGVDSKTGILASLIMGSTETTIYVISVYGSKLKNRNMKPALILGLIGDFICVVSAIVFYNVFF